MPVEAIEISELEEFEPSRVDGVGKGANGFPILMIKGIDGETTETEGAIGDVLAELDKADADAETADRPACKTCDGSGKIMDGNRKCPDCFGSGKAPKVGESAKAFLEAIKTSDGAAASGADVPVTNDCPTCNGGGNIADGTADGKTCIDCNGSGKDSKMQPDSNLKTMDADTGKVTEGAGGRETVDKAVAERYDITEDGYIAKRDFDRGTGGGTDRDKIPAEDFAGPDRSFPIVTQSDVSDAWGLRGHADDPAAVGAKIKAIAKRKGFTSPDGPNDPKAAKGVVEKDGMVSGPNPFLGATVSTATDSSDDSTDDGDASTPGSPAWEAVDAQTATDAAMALMAASELIRTFAQREAQEVVAGEGNDVFDTSAAYSALCGVSDALGIMAQMAFHEGLEAAKSLPDDEVVEKAGRRLSSKTVQALATARDKAKDLANHVTGVLGDDDPAKKKSDGATGSGRFIANANKALLEQEIESMSTDELEKVLDARDEKLVGLLAEAFKQGTATKAGKDTQDVDNSNSIAGAKNANNKAKTKKPKDEDTDLEDEADQGDDDSASSPASGAAKADGDDAEKAELTEEEIEAREAKKAAKKALKDAKHAENQATENAATARAIEEAVAKATAAVDSLKDQLATAQQATEERIAAAEKATQDRLATVEKMAAPSTIARTAPVTAAAKSVELDTLDLEITKYENLAKTVDDMNYRRECNDRVKALRVKRNAMVSGK